MVDHNEKKLRDMAKAARKFIKAADTLVNGTHSRYAYKTGTEASKTAQARFEKADAAYDTARKALELWTEGL